MKTEVNVKNERYSMGIAFGWSADIAVCALACAVNDLAARGAVSFCVGVRILVPVGAAKACVYAARSALKEECLRRGIRLSGIREQREAALCLPMILVTCVSDKEAEAAGDCGGAAMRAGQAIVLTKWAGMEGMLRIAAEKKEELQRRFAPAFLREIEAFRPEIFALREIEAAKARGVSVIRQAGEGGIFAALWRLAEEAGRGFTLHMEAISVLQETIEICELFRLNPYQLTSVGTLLMVAEEGEALAEALIKEGVPAAVIGHLTDSQDKIIKNGEDVRYLDRPAPDEYNKIFTEAEDEKYKARNTTVS